VALLVGLDFLRSMVSTGLLYYN